ncbi:putative acyl-CoA dehydrogenase [Chromobacterium alkanivorans]|uniref:acyl-CoA dehydrogenase family protein n=1 Tax=Chromobacterium alkanivorans TaxID=1071719 RepID=UPI00216A5F89|nr:acyl-CoA dehydrogenase family protein [Chromobacterium alkanivorans]MCS3806458.1 putative acyl-CoA dehydrogenase [Chromobacterium alkanivorans]MCS3820847.1 putative acyl-CoA dehydrogenase [Chromobacterium alkanivorans]MCS3875769.1 putative acyl-CoA dehydrogenase [Chromobacterium alkanivorans]
MIWQTHEVSNQYEELADYSLYDSDPALNEVLLRADAGWAEAGLRAYGERLGRADSFELAEQANRHAPELRAFDRRGRRIDQVDSHPSWHQLLALYREQGLVSMPFDSERTGRWSATMAGLYLHGQLEAGSLCPATMTQAAIPLLRREPALWALLGDKLFSRVHDSRDLPLERKASAWIGMGMTEKQGGSDLRANTTRATPLGAGGRGGEYLLRGHKWFWSAPMCDAHLVLAKTADGASCCFYVPRWRPDGERNAVRIQRLKDKVGNRSNAGCEVEFQDAWGVLIGEEGRGIPTIIEMAGYTRLNCVIGSAALLRQGTVQALAYARRRAAFGKRLAEQPIMRAVLADLALESEAALQLAARLSEAFERDDAPALRGWKRIVTPAAKFWVCKRAVALSGEAMEVFGGNGYVDGPMARLYREAPLNSIWEGAGNVMCLDVLRALQREPAAWEALLAELEDWAGDEAATRRALAQLRALAAEPEPLEWQGRRFAQLLVLTAQACLLLRHAPAALARGFVDTRLDDGQWGRVAGALDARRLDVEAILLRALPV